MATTIDTSYPKKTSFRTVLGVVPQEQDAPDVKEAQGDCPYLEGCWPNGDVFHVSVASNSFVIGRAPDTNLVVPRSIPYASGRHIEIQKMPTGYAIVDLNSTNGTHLNQRPLMPMNAVRLNDGDVIQIGPVDGGLTFHFKLPVTS